MPVVPLGQKAFKRADAFVPEVRCLNMFLEPDTSGISPDQTLRVQRPGLELSATLPGPMRALEKYTQTGERLAVAGTTLYANEIDKGDVGAGGRAQIVTTAFLAAVLSANQLFAYQGSLLTAVDVPDIDSVVQIPIAIDQLNGYILVLCLSGSFFWMLPGEVTIDPLNFATAESSPDAGVAIARLVDEFWIFGSDTTEVWQSTGDGDAPFQRASGRVYASGCISRDSVQRFDNSLVWVADDGTVLRGGAAPQVISDPGIAERIERRQGQPSAWTASIANHRFYMLRIPGEGTFVFDASTSLWSQWQSVGEVVWLPHVGYMADGLIFCGSSEGGDLWRLGAELADDAGVPQLRLVTGTVPIQGKPPRNDSLSIGVGCSGETVARIRWKDGQDDYPDYYDELTVRAPLEIATMYRLGQPDQPFRTFEASFVGPERVSLYGMTANQAFQ